MSPAKITVALVILINCVMIVIKLCIYKVTSSVAVLSSFIDSAFDLLLSAINSLVLLYAMKPKDDDHRFGHGAAEDVVALIQVFLIAFASIFMFYNIVHLDVEKYHFSWISTSMMLFNMLPLCLIVFLQYRTQKKVSSTIINADMLHYTTDFLSTAGVVLAMILTHFTNILWFDIACGAVVMLVIIYSCIKGAIHAINNLMARELQNGTREIVEEILRNSKDIATYKGLRTRGSGQIKFIQFDIIFNEDTSLKVAHEVAHQIEDLIHEKIKDADVTIHLEPNHCPRHHGV